MILYITVKRLFRRRCSNVGHPRSWTILLAFTVACTIPGRVALDQFKLVGVPASVRVPDSGSVLDSRPDVGIVGYVASIFGARHQFSGKKSYTDLVFMYVCMYVYIYFRHKTHSTTHKQTHKKNRTNSNYQQKQQNIDIERCCC